MILLHRLLDLRHHLLRSLAAFRAQRLLDKRAAQRIGQLAVGQIHAALPARTHLLGAAQNLAIEIEVLLLKRSRQNFRVGVHQMPCQIRLQIVQAGLGDHAHPAPS